MAGRSSVLICRGHGVVSAAHTVELAVLQAISIDRLAAMALRVRAVGGVPRDTSTNVTGMTYRISA